MTELYKRKLHILYGSSAKIFAQMHLTPHGLETEVNQWPQWRPATNDRFTLSCHRRKKLSS